VTFASFSGAGARRSQKEDADSKQCAATIQAALEGVVLLEEFAKSVVDVHILVVEGQGGEGSGRAVRLMLALPCSGVCQQRTACPKNPSVRYPLAYGC
jgi:ribonuclease PH